MKFSKGEIVISFDHGPETAAKYGHECECTIFRVGPFAKGQAVDGIYRIAVDADYVIQMPDGKLFGSPEKTLRKRPSDDDQLFTRWFRDHIITEPLVETMTRTMRNLETFTEETGRGL